MQNKKHNHSNKANIIKEQKRQSFGDKQENIDRRSKSYHVDMNSEQYYLDETLNMKQNPKLNDSKEKLSEEENNLSNEYNNSSMIFQKNQEQTNDILSYNISDDKFLKFLNKYLNYLEENNELNESKTDNEKEIPLDNNETNKLFLQKIFYKYKKKCFDFENLQQKFLKQIHLMKFKEKNLQKVIFCKNNFKKSSENFSKRSRNNKFE